ncbi:MAG: NfeD family protein [Azovibrio sp.]|uniref:NfeD family protein n=1 Tax=Azovibrio sp. TaxID=1872673 RepID=UPI003C71CA3D
MWLWLILAALLLSLEMVTGTFALLFAGLGALAAAVLAYLAAASLTAQIAIFALASVAGTVLAWHRLKHERSLPMETEEVGQEVQVVVPPDALGCLRVRYRGSEWPARLGQDGLSVQEGSLLVVLAQEGSLLVVGRRLDS